MRHIQSLHIAGMALGLGYVSTVIVVQHQFKRVCGKSTATRHIGMDSIECTPSTMELFLAKALYKGPMNYTDKARIL